MNNNKDTYVYEYQGGLYINLTNRCTNACEFCIRNDNQGVDDYNLWMKKEPTAQEVIDQLKDYPQYSSVTFCGFGEPMIRLDEMIEISQVLKTQSIKVKVNTNGHANAFHGKDILPSLVGLVDVFSISLNADNKQDYQAICHSQYGENGYDYMLDFARRASELNFKVVLSIIDHMPVDMIKNCKTIAKDAGATLRIRHLV